MSEITWGRRYLMCPPEHFQVTYEINPWMHKEIVPDHERAVEQFDTLVHTIIDAGAEVEMMDPVAGLPDLVFTANAGLVSGSRFLPSRFRHPERQGETVVDIAHFSSRGYEILELPAGGCQEGAGDALPFFPEVAGDSHRALVCGYRFRSDVATHAALSSLLSIPTLSVELIDERLYHLDLCFCPLDGRSALVAETAFDHYGLAVIESLVPDVVRIDRDDSLTFCANSVVIGRRIVMPACPPSVGRALESRGFDVAIVDVSEFIKAGGGCRCLTLALDVTLS